MRELSVAEFGIKAPAGSAVLAGTKFVWILGIDSIPCCVITTIFWIKSLAITNGLSCSSCIIRV